MKSYTKRYQTLVTFIMISALLPIVDLAMADVPKHFSYQGFLKDGNNNPREGSVNLVIEFYDADSQGNLLFSEEFNDIGLDDGVYSIQIGMGTILSGAITDLINSQTNELWLAESIDGQALTPRIRIGSSLFALKARHAEELVIPGTTKSAVRVNNMGYLGLGRVNPENQSPVDPIDQLTLFVPAAGDNGITLTEGLKNGARISYSEVGNHLRIAGLTSGSMQGGITVTRGEGNVGIGTETPQHPLDVVGTIGSGGVVYHSDLRWKKNIESIENGVAKILKLRGVEYEWRTDEFEDKNFRGGKQIGFIAQEMEKVVPEVVKSDNSGFKSLDYGKLVPILVEAVKEINAKQTVTIEQFENEIQTLKAENHELRSIVDTLKGLPAQMKSLKQQLSELAVDEKTLYTKAREVEASSTAFAK